MPDIREVLKGLSIEDRALYTEVRTQMRKAYLAAHSKLLPIEQYEVADDAFLDLIDIKIALLFDRSGSFDHSEGSIDNGDKIEEEIKTTFESAASKMIKATEPNANGTWTSKVN